MGQELAQIALIGLDGVGGHAPFLGQRPAPALGGGAERGVAGEKERIGIGLSGARGHAASKHRLWLTIG